MDAIELLGAFGFMRLGPGEASEPASSRLVASGEIGAVAGDICSVLYPRLMVEVGSGSGASTLAWLAAGSITDLEVICVDTWLGNYETRHPSNRQSSEWGLDSLGLVDGFPTLYRSFAQSIRSAGYYERVVPMPWDSDQALALLGELGIKPHLCFLDASHAFQGLYRTASALLDLMCEGESEGVLCVSSFSPDWPGTQAAVLGLAQDRGLALAVHGTTVMLAGKADHRMESVLQRPNWARVE